MVSQREIGAFSVITNLRMELFGALEPGAVPGPGQQAADLGVPEPAGRGPATLPLHPDPALQADHLLLPGHQVHRQG